MPANGESELKKMKSEDLTLLGEASATQKSLCEKTNSAYEDTDKTRRNMVKVRRNLLKGKSCSSSLKLKAVNTENKHSQDKLEKKKIQTSRTKPPTVKSDGKRNRKEEKENPKADVGSSDKNCKNTKDSEIFKTHTDIPTILSAIASMENRMHKDFMEMKTSNESIFKQVYEELGKIKTDFNARMDGLAKKIEKRVCESLTK